jgi:hypothetical protein
LFSSQKLYHLSSIDLGSYLLGISIKVISDFVFERAKIGKPHEIFKPKIW